MQTMLTRLSNSWNLLKASLRVLAADKELIVFPILSAVGMLLVTLTFALPILFSRVIDGIFWVGGWRYSAWRSPFCFTWCNTR
jgi:hypothetical protein